MAHRPNAEIDEGLLADATWTVRCREVGARGAPLKVELGPHWGLSSGYSSMHLQNNMS